MQPGAETLLPLSLDPEFDKLWAANDMVSSHPALVAAEAAYEQLARDPENGRGIVHITDVTLRDGQQQRTNEVTTAQRVEVFDNIVETGVDRIEIGHIGNSNGDQELAGAIVKRIAELEHKDPRYANVKLQVLVGSQSELIQSGIKVLHEAFQAHYGEEWQEIMADKMVIHVYDALDQRLLDTRSTPYDQQDSARRIKTAAQYAVNAGFKHFSISGEATTAATPEEAMRFYRSITTHLLAQGGESVNINLANTYGFSANPLWNSRTIAWVNTAVKYGFPEGRVTTSIHTHDDGDNAVDVSVGAIRAGVDRVEGALIGMGERAGNTATITVVDRLLEAGLHQHEASLRAHEGRRSGIADQAGKHALSRVVQLDPGIIPHLRRWYSAADRVAEIFGRHADFRWERTPVGNPYAHDNGSGPHDRVMTAAVEDPVHFPPYRTYGSKLAIHSILGMPEADLLAIGDPDAIRRVTVGNHAGGGSTQAIASGVVDAKRAAPAGIELAKYNFGRYKSAILGHVATGTLLVAA